MFPESDSCALHPLSDAQKTAVHAVMQEMLNSAHFCKSKRYPALLKYTVCYTLDGETGALKERVIGAELFGRPLDYETSIDPVVRVTAGELRRRMALFFSENPDCPVIIDLPVGSYAVRFTFRDPSCDAQPAASHAHLSSAEPEPSTTEEQSPAPDHRDTEGNAIRHELAASAALSSADSQHEHLPSAAHRPMPPSRLKALALALGALIVVLLVAAMAFAWHRKSSMKYIFWKPVLATNSAPAIIVLGNDGITPTPLAARQTGNNTRVIFDNVLVAANVCGILKEYGKNCPMQLSDKVFFSDMQNHTTVLIGALDNLWTLRIMSDLRYQFHFDSPTDPAIPKIEHAPLNFHARLIADQQNPAHLWTLQPSPTTSPESYPTDYAVIARYHSVLTNGTVIVLAGITPASTAAAEQISLSHNLLRQVYAMAPSKWDGQNFEAVVQIEMLHDAPVTTKVIAAECW